MTLTAGKYVKWVQILNKVSTFNQARMNQPLADKTPGRSPTMFSNSIRPALIWVKIDIWINANCLRGNAWRTYYANVSEFGPAIPGMHFEPTYSTNSCHLRYHVFIWAYAPSLWVRTYFMDAPLGNFWFKFNSGRLKQGWTSPVKSFCTQSPHSSWTKFAGCCLARKSSVMEFPCPYCICRLLDVISRTVRLSSFF